MGIKPKASGTSLVHLPFSYKDRKILTKKKRKKKKQQLGKFKRQISYEAVTGWRNKSFFKWLRSHDQDAMVKTLQKSSQKPNGSIYTQHSVIRNKEKCSFLDWILAQLSLWLTDELIVWVVFVVVCSLSSVKVFKTLLLWNNGIGEQKVVLMVQVTWHNQQIISWYRHLGSWS